MHNAKLPLSFYQHDDVLSISRELLGKVLVSRVRDESTGKIVTTSGIIIETEAYRGPEDKASHAYNYRRTKRTETMFAAGGRAYVYLCYGIHSLFNVVTGPQGTPHGVLVRAIRPLAGIEHMLQRRNHKILKPTLSSGPGVLTSALGIKTIHNNTDLTSTTIWIENQNYHVNQKQIIATPRIGIGYAEEYADLPWRFILNDY